MSWNQLTAYTPLYLRELHVPAAQVPGWIAAISSLGWVLALPLAPFWGVLADRYSRKLIIVRSAAIEAVIFAGWALSTTPWMALAFRCLNGFILGNTGVMLAMQASTTPRQRLALAVGIVGAGSPAGRAVGPILGALLVHLVGGRLRGAHGRRAEQLVAPLRDRAPRQCRVPGGDTHHRYVCHGRDGQPREAWRGPGPDPLSVLCRRGHRTADRRGRICGRPARGVRHRRRAQPQSAACALHHAARGGRGTDRLTTRVGVVADTPCPEFIDRLPDRIFDVMRGVQVVVHAGDIDGASTLAELARIAPVEAVRGDHDRSLTTLPATHEVVVEGQRIVVVHGNRARWIEEPQTLLWTLSLGYLRPHGGLPRSLRRRFPTADVIVYGHTHRSHPGNVEGPLLFNTGGVHQWTRTTT